MRTLRRTGAALAAVALAAVTSAASLAGAARAAPASASRAQQAPAARVELVSQTPTVTAGGTFELAVRLTGLPDDGLIQLALHGRVRSRSELAESMEGRGLRSEVYDVTQPLASIPLAADGTRRLSIPGGIPLTAPGAYPLEVVAQRADLTELASLVTHVLVRPGPSDESPPLAVAVLARIGARPALQPDGSYRLSSRQVEGDAQLVSALAAAPDTPATLDVTPETLDALSSEPAEGAPDILDLLRVAASRRAVMSHPYVDVSPDVLAASGLSDELAQQLDRGRAVLGNMLGVEPSGTTWRAGPDLDDRGLRLLGQTGVRHVVVDPAQVEPLRSGIISLSLAQPFLLTSGAGPAIDAVALDRGITERLGTRVEPGLETSRLLAEMAMLWFEQPGIARGVVVPVDGSIRPDVVKGLLAGVGAGGIFHAVTLDQLFADADPLRQPGGGRVDRALVPGDDGAIGGDLADALRATRTALASFVQLVGEDSPRAEPVAAQLLVATARGLDGDERHAHVDAARAAIASVTAGISAPPHETVTLTARDGTVPLSLRNDAGFPVDVVVRMRSPKLEFPGGDTIPLTLSEPTTRLDIAVRARASGAFPLDVTVTSPDGGLVLADVSYSVQSTAVSGVGVVLSAGAAFFLMVWWARHWRRTRRSRKLVAAEASTPAATATGSGGDTTEAAPH
jgi:hypothetical protein